MGYFTLSARFGARKDKTITKAIAMLCLVDGDLSKELCFLDKTLIHRVNG
jgi:hypothetical protein